MTQVRSRTVRRGLEATKSDRHESTLVAEGRAALASAQTDLAVALAGLAETGLADDLARNVAERLERLNWLLERALEDWPR